MFGNIRFEGGFDCQKMSFIFCSRFEFKNTLPKLSGNDFLTIRASSKACYSFVST
jgi:hypothetical protein